MDPFLFLGHTSLNYVYAEHHHRELLAEAEHERRVAQNSASPPRWAAVLCLVRAGRQALHLVRTRMTGSERMSSLQRAGHRPAC